jgi:hypothetical protein
MRLTVVILLTTSSSLGCMGMAGAEPEAADIETGLRLEGEVEEDGAIRWSLHNDGEDVVTVGCESGFCWDPPLMRLEARQSDGSWAEVEPRLRHRVDRDALRQVIPSGSTHLAEAYDVPPGLFRATVRVETADGPVEVERELAVVGWSQAHAARGIALLGRAREEACFVRWNLRTTLFRSVEADDVLTILETTTDDERLSVLMAMFDRGVFVVELSEEVRGMDETTFDDFADRLADELRAYQKPVREAVALRLFESVEPGTNALTSRELSRLGRFQNSWPLHAPDALVLRLEDGPEEDDALAALVDLMVQAPLALFEADRRRILDALDARCAGAIGPLEASCDEAKIHFDPNEFHFAGLGLSGTSRCGGVGVVELGICAEIDASFQALTAEAGLPEVHFLAGAVRATH